MKRILHVVTTMDYGGVETLLMSIYRNIDRTKVQFDFLCHNTCDNLFSKEIEELGGKMYSIPYASKVGYFGYLKALHSFFKEHPEYDVVHSHVNGENGNVLRMAKKAGVPIRISHSHVANIKEKITPKTIYRSLIRIYIPNAVTHCFACSKAACEHLYLSKKDRQDCVILNNSINTKKFTFSKSSRFEIREKYGLQDKFVIGNIGRFSNEKNQRFSIKVFEEYLIKDPNAVLILLGDGKDRSELEEYVSANGLKDKVLFLGSQKNVPDFLSAMDMFLFPSTYEGLGIVAIEAQANGLQVLASSAVPRETDITDLISYYPLDDITLWVNALVETKQRSENIEREKYALRVKEMKYDIEDTSKWLEEFYLSL